MMNMVKSFKDISPELQAFAGGKGGMLARMLQKGYPVPEGFVVLPAAFQGDSLRNEAWGEIKSNLAAIRSNKAGALFAVRSSALSEDSAQASFAGEFETVLNVKSDEEIREAIYEVFRSRHSERVKAYSVVQGIDQAHQIAVVVQMMVKSELSGVLFTADPITGSHKEMVGNYVHGLGEQLVSGEANPYSFKLDRPKGKYVGPAEFKKYASRLYELASKLEKEMGLPQDIEWAVEKGKLYILQSRPITSLRTVNYDTYEVNDSLDGDFIWTSNNVGEALPDVLTPITWSLLRELDLECQKLTGYYLWSGNICGRVYSNISMALSMMSYMGIGVNFGKKLMSDVFGNIPDGMKIPIYPFGRLELFKDLKIRGSRNIKRLKDAQKHKDEYLKNTQSWCEDKSRKIKDASRDEELLALWDNKIRPYVSALWNIWLGGASNTTLVTLRKSLVKLVGEEDANLILSNFRGENGLESLGPLVGIAKVAKSEMKKEEYMAKYGHRSAHEFELSFPYPSEDKDYLNKQLEEYKKSGVDVDTLLEKQFENYMQAKTRFIQKYPHKKKWLEKNEEKIMKGAQLREALRSEFVKTFKVMREYMLKLGELKNIGSDVFFLYTHEIPELLNGNDGMLRHMAARKANFERYKTLPVLPQFIRGRFDAFKWAKDENRRLDYYDPSAASETKEVTGDDIKGFAGAAGKIEGVVRVLERFEDGEKLEPGEILVTSTTNIGWTPLFPKAAAIITDIGAPLSHAAIVARELGIPAVVGCGNATTKLRTGDRIIVDGGQGVIRKIK